MPVGILATAAKPAAPYARRCHRLGKGVSGVAVDRDHTLWTGLARPSIA